MLMSPLYEVNEALVAMGAEKLNMCMQCGMCAGSCPWRVVNGDFNVRRLVRMAQLGVEGYECDDILYGCTTCNKCVIKCPRGVTIIDIVKAMRSMVAETGAMPSSLRAVSGSIRSNGNPWSEPREKRIQCIDKLALPLFDGSQEYFLSMCCTSAFDIRNRSVITSIVKVLNACGVSFGVLGEKETCCGESMRKIGDEDLFLNIAQKNIKLFNENGVKKVITTSPHCLWSFLKEYPEYGGNYDVLHHTQLFAKLLDEGTLKITNGFKGKITYHDPCYLGRHNEEYEAPRKLLKSVAGENFIEMPRNCKDSLCCGGGGGRLWMETKPAWRFSDLRVKEAAETGAEVLATACPYCIIMLEDSRKTTGNEDKLTIKDVAELLADSI